MAGVALPAASLLVVRDGDAGLEVLMLARSRRMAFAGGMLVFPGGRVEDADRRLARRRTVAAGTGLPPDERAHRLAALREAFEETGLLAAILSRRRRPPGERERAAIARRDRARLQSGRLSFARLLSRRDLLCDLRALLPFAHWITPELAPRRFDTRFYLCRAPAGQRASCDGIESLAAAWRRPRDVLADHPEHSESLMFPTRLTLMKLARAGSVAEALTLARRTAVMPLAPRLAPDGTLHLSLPREAGFGISDASERASFRAAASAQPRQTSR